MVGAALAAVVAPRVALAHGDSGGTQLPKDAPPVTKDGEEAKATFKRIEADAGLLGLVKATIEKGERALARAQGAKLSSDDEGAHLLSKLALGLAKDAEATIRAADAEKKADDAQAKAAELAEEVTRMKTLLAETEAHRATVAADLARAQDDAKKTAGDTAKKEEKRLEKAVDPKDKKKQGAPKQ